MAHVCIIVHRQASFDDEPYVLREVARCWAEAGHRVTVRRGPPPGGAAEGDVAILHVDLTLAPADHAEYVRRFPVAINGAVTDISKRAVSANLVGRADAYAGAVIVKTTWNCGGMREKLLAANGPPWRRLARAARDALPWAYRARLSTSNYRIFNRAADVPRAAWRNPNLVVERFLPERRGDLYCLRTWMFLGDRETHSVCYSRSPVVKSRTVIGRDALPTADVPPDLRRRRRELGFDFGKFDFAVVDGRAVLYDANRTPSVGTFPPEQFLPRMRLLAEGLDGFL